MKVFVRFGPSVAQTRDVKEVILPDGATLADLIEHFHTHHQILAQRLYGSYAVTSGRALAQTDILADEQEIMFVSALAGG